MIKHSKFTQVYEERVRSLLDDHYCKRYDHRTSSLYMTRLKHMSNGNEIVLKGYPGTQRIEQRTNNILVHQEIVFP